jgi:hypothetical protein
VAERSGAARMRHTELLARMEFGDGGVGLSPDSADT